MYNFDLVKVNASMVKAVRLCVALRRFFGKEAAQHCEFMDLEREIREAAAECQRVVELMKVEAKWPLISG